MLTTGWIHWSRYIEPGSVDIQLTDVGPMPFSSKAIDLAAQQGECEAAQLRLRHDEQCFSPRCQPRCSDAIVDGIEFDYSSTSSERGTAARFLGS